jgi:hypothetical protein
MKCYLNPINTKRSFLRKFRFTGILLWLFHKAFIANNIVNPFNKNEFIKKTVGITNCFIKNNRNYPGKNLSFSDYNPLFSTAPWSGAFPLNTAFPFKSKSNPNFTPLSIAGLEETRL